MRTSREREIDTTIKGVPRNFSAVGVQPAGVDQIPMIIGHQSWPWPKDSIFLFGRDAQAVRGGAQVFIEIFPLPEKTLDAKCEELSE